MGRLGTLCWPPLLIGLFLQTAQPVRAQELSIVYTGELWQNTRGGIRTGSAYLDNLDLTLAIDTESLGAWRNGRFFAYALYNNGTQFSASHVGDAQIVSNIEAPGATRLYELWYEHGLLDDTLTWRFGLYDLNSEFYVTDASSQFIQSAHGIGTDFGQTGINGPSIFPNTALGLRLNYCPGDWCLRAAVFDGVPGDPGDLSRTAIRLDEDEGALVVAEVVPLRSSSLRAGVGYWHYTADFQPLDPMAPPNDGNDGWYGFVEGTLANGPQWFLRYGEAADEFNQFRRGAGLGAVFSSPLDWRGQDVFGIAAAWAHNGKPFRSAQESQGMPVRDSELNIELFYRATITPWLAIQPDLQYVINPNTSRSLSDALAIGLRFQLSFDTRLAGQ